MAEAFLMLDEVLTLEPLRRASVRGAGLDSEVHMATLDTAAVRVALLDAAGDPVATVVQAGQQPPRGPVVELPPGTSAIEAYRTTLTALVERSRSVARRSRIILQSLTEADLQGRSLQDIVTLLSDLVGNPVAMHDPHYRILAWSGDREAMDAVRTDTVTAGQVPSEVMEALASRGILARLREERRPFRIEGDLLAGMGPRVVCPVVAGDVRFGHLSISEGARRLDTLDLLAVDSGATVVAFHLSRQRAVEESIRGQRALLLYELLFAPEGWAPRSWRRHAALLGFDVHLDFHVVLIAFDRPADDSAGWARQLDSVVATLDTALDRMGVAPFIAMAELDAVVMIVPAATPSLPDVVAALLREVDAYHRLPPMAAGVSQPRRASAGLGRSYEEARLAVRLGRTLHGPHSVTPYAGLGVLRLLNEVGQDALTAYLDSILGTDDGFREQFLVTFGALVESGYNKAEAARRLYIHVNTLKYRLRRISRVTGQNPADHQGRFALECTLRLLELQRARRL